MEVDARQQGAVMTEVEGRRLRLSNLGKVLYPASGFTKGDLIDYYARVAPTLVPHLRRRPVSLRRYPDGTDHEGFYEKQVPRGAPDWVASVELPSPGSSRGRGTVTYVLVEETATLVWLSNLAVVELHVPQWSVGPRGAARDPDLLVFDLDPGEPATVVECCRVALMLRELLREDGLTGYPKTSGSKGLQVYVPIAPANENRTTEYARRLAAKLTADEPGLVIDRMERSARPNLVFVDWSQNRKAKTTVAPYSLRGRDLPTASTPVTWGETEACRIPDDLRFQAPDVLDRIHRHGDLLAPLLDADRPRLPRG